jgi:hypothetical protein
VLLPLAAPAVVYLVYEEHAWQVALLAAFSSFVSRLQASSSS